MAKSEEQEVYIWSPRRKIVEMMQKTVKILCEKKKSEFLAQKNKIGRGMTEKLRIKRHRWRNSFLIAVPQCQGGISKALKNPRILSSQ